MSIQLTRKDAAEYSRSFVQSLASMSNGGQPVGLAATSIGPSPLQLHPRATIAFGCRSRSFAER
jgi:hypothetical protein